MSRALLLRLLFVMALVVGNWALWGPRGADAARSQMACNFVNGGLVCEGACGGNAQCCVTECDCGDC